MTPWLLEAYKFIGLREIKGSVHSEDILQFWKDIKRGGIKNDETPWCAAFVGAMLERAGIQSSRYESAGSYENWGSEILLPKLGCIVTFRRTGGGHVGFVVGKTAAGKLQVLGGNQNDSVSIAEFDPIRVSSLRWPKLVPLVNDPLTELAVNHIELLSVT